MNRHINLLSKRDRSSEKSVLVWVVLAIFLVGLGATGVMQQMQYSTLAQEANKSQQLVAAAERELKEKRRAAGFQDPEVLNKDIAALRSKINANRGLLAQVESGELGVRKGHTDLFRLFANHAEKGVWITGVDVTNAGNAVTLSGRALSSQAVMRLSRRLNSAFKGRDPEFQFTAVEITKADIRVTAPSSSSAAPAPSAPSASSAAGPAAALAGRAPTIDSVRFTLN